MPVLKSEIDEKDLTEALKFYVGSGDYAEVYTVTCRKCGKLIAIEILDPSAPNPSRDDGRTLLPIGTAYWSSRQRPDGVMGYQCMASVPNPKFDNKQPETIFNLSRGQCGNDSRTSDQEEQFFGDVLTQRDPLPHEMAAFQQQGIEQPSVVVKGNKIDIEGFTLEKLK